jgi:hypothetical protein
MFFAKVFYWIGLILYASNPICPGPVLYTQKELDKVRKRVMKMKEKYIKLLNKRMKHQAAGKPTEKDDDKIREVVFKIQSDENLLDGVTDILLGT